MAKVCALLLPLATASPAAAQPSPAASVGFSNLIVRIKGDDEIGMAGAELRVQILERLRKNNFNAVGAENLVFDKDESARAAFRLGGTVSELTCVRGRSRLRCRVGVEWQLLNVSLDQVIYSVLTRHSVIDMPEGDRKKMPGALIFGALDSLMKRDGFRKALARAPEPPTAKETFAPATFARCAAAAKKMPAASEGVLTATVVIRTERGFGSGFFLTPDGLLLTAAHVVDAPSVKLRLRDGTEVAAMPIRIARDLDVALLRTSRPISGQACLALNPDTIAVGSEVFAAGAPADEKLAFSLSRGIVSSIRQLDGRRQIQTDAAVSPGNSGGPLIDASAAAIAVVTSKVVARKVEGIAFGAPIQEVLTTLALTPGASTDAALLAASSVGPSAAPKGAPVVDDPDPVPSLFPDGDPELAERRKEAEEERALEQRRKEQRLAHDQAAEEARAIESWRRAERDRLTPFHVQAMFWGGLGLIAAGGAAGIASFALYDRGETTKPEFKTLNALNIVGWSAVGLGAGSIVASAILRPPLPPAPEKAPPASARATMLLGPGSVGIRGQF